MSASRFLLPILFSFFLVACGGGGSSSSNNESATGDIDDNAGNGAGGSGDPGSGNTFALNVTPEGFQFSIPNVSTANFYRLFEDPDGQSGFGQLGEDIPQGTSSVTFGVPIHLRVNAEYLLQNCIDSSTCSDAATVNVTGNLAEGITYIKAHNPTPEFSGAAKQFGYSVSVSGDGSTLAVGAPFESSVDRGVFAGTQGGLSHGNLQSQLNSSGAVYIFTRSSDGRWGQQAYLKAHNAHVGQFFGGRVALNNGGDTLSVSAFGDNSPEVGVFAGSTGGADLLPGETFGAVFVFTRSGETWNQQAYLKPHNNLNARPDFTQQTFIPAGFGSDIALSADGNTLAVGAARDDGHANGVFNGESAPVTTVSDVNARGRNFFNGAVFIFSRSGTNWIQQSYIKQHNNSIDQSQVQGSVQANFGISLDLSDDGNSLIVGAPTENSLDVGIFNGVSGGTTFDFSTRTNGNFGELAFQESGAAYLFVRNGEDWSQQAFIKPDLVEPQMRSGDFFGYSVAISGDGGTVAISAPLEDGGSTGIGGDQTENLINASGAVYVFERSGQSLSQQAYIKQSNTASIPNGRGNVGDTVLGQQFGASLDINQNGSLIAVGAPREASGSVGINGSQLDNSSEDAGATYLFERVDLTWSQISYIKTNVNRSQFGLGAFLGGFMFNNIVLSEGVPAKSVALNDDGATLVVSAIGESSLVTGINNDPNDGQEPFQFEGAVYVYGGSDSLSRTNGSDDVNNGSDDGNTDGSDANTDGADTLEITLTWVTDADLDLRVIEPDGTEIFFNNLVSGSGGQLLADDIDGFGPETIVYNEQPPSGNYRVEVSHSSGTLPTNYTVSVTQNGSTASFSGTLITPGEREVVTTAIVDSAAGNVMDGNTSDGGNGFPAIGNGDGVTTGGFDLTDYLYNDVLETIGNSIFTSFETLTIEGNVFGNFEFNETRVDENTIETIGGGVDSTTVITNDQISTTIDGFADPFFDVVFNGLINNPSSLSIIDFDARRPAFRLSGLTNASSIQQGEVGSTFTSILNCDLADQFDTFNLADVDAPISVGTDVFNDVILITCFEQTDRNANDGLVPTVISRFISSYYARGIGLVLSEVEINRSQLPSASENTRVFNVRRN